ncbi:Uncharacterized protein APZ42_026317 [Daphnia magna]|uniref:Uncharacterized protein n=1 Tax=Daphnia magna TaxID=35525 RepID=A0A164SCQ6_9CRUS|nr:Uncharacterized protein APZ42_026317 [Daphnia magna]
MAAQWAYWGSHQSLDWMGRMRRFETGTRRILNQFFFSSNIKDTQFELCGQHNSTSNFFSSHFNYNI